MSDDNYRINHEAEINFRIIKTMDMDARSLSDFLFIAKARGYCREWAETKYALRMAGKA